MKRQLRILAVTVMACLLSSTVAPAKELSWGEEKLLETFRALESGTMAPPDAEEYCGRYLNAMPHAFIDPMRELAAGLLDVYWTLSTDRACEAMVELNIAGQLRTQQLRKAAEAEDDVTQAREVGRILRAIYFAHQRNLAASQSGEASQ